jgi:hypothetical protein
MGGQLDEIGAYSSIQGQKSLQQLVSLPSPQSQEQPELLQAK